VCAILRSPYVGGLSLLTNGIGLEAVIPAFIGERDKTSLDSLPEHSDPSGFIEQP